MRLSNRERHVLASIQLRGPGTVHDVARETGYQMSSVRYTVGRLKEKGLLRPYPLINVSTLGYTEYLLFFTPGGKSRSMRAALQQELLDSPRVAWFSRHYGGYDYMLVIIVRDAAEVVHFLDDLSSRYPDVFFDKSTGTVVSWSLFARRYLWRDTHPSYSGVTVERTEGIVPLDTLDKNILHVLANRPFDSYRAVARQLGIPHTTLDYRLQRLRETGVFRGMVFSVDPLRAGMHAVRLLLFMRGTSAEQRKRLATFSEEHPYVVTLIRVYGSCDYIIRLEVTEPAEVSDVTQALHETFPSELQTIQAMTLSEDLKNSTYPFAWVDEED